MQGLGVHSKAVTLPLHHLCTEQAQPREAPLSLEKRGQFLEKFDGP